ncbi:ABC transporter permease [Thalassobaculum sp.]|uniref:ABC transporter permease n=1 Tax=Thalassobaculum sp. TaxID=2022740 RepID=UPI0032EB71C8
MATFAEAAPPASVRRFDWIRRNPTIVIGAFILGLLATLALIAPWIADDPLGFDPLERLRRPSAEFLFGTDEFGRDVYSRVVYGARISLAVGISVATIATVAGLFIGVLCGYFRKVDNVVMRVMDGLMAIPPILLAIALITLMKASLTIVIIAISIPEIPRVVRLVRSVVLQVRGLPYIEAAIASGTRTRTIMTRHILPNTLAPLIVQATYACASAILTEAGLSFLGAGTPPEIPSWGNVISLGRTYFQIAPWIIFFPGVMLAITVLAINLMGDGLRDTLDPRIARRM